MGEGGSLNQSDGKKSYHSGATIDTIYLYTIVKINIVGEVMVLPPWFVS